MPKATVTIEATRINLKSCPGGYIEIKPLPYGKLLHRRDRATKMSMEQRQGQRDDTQKFDLEMMQQFTRAYEFKNCIVDHNLQDEAGNKLNFAMDATLDLLDPKVGQEIEREIDKLNSDDEDLETFTSQSTPSSTVEAETDK